MGGLSRDSRLRRNSDLESQSQSIQSYNAEGSKINITPTLTAVRGNAGNTSSMPSTLDRGHRQTTLNSLSSTPMTSTTIPNDQSLQQQQTNAQDSIQQQLLSAMNTLQLAQLQQMQQQQQQQQLALNQRPESAGSTSKKKRKKKKKGDR